MAEVTNDLLYDVLKSIQTRLSTIEQRLDDFNRHFVAMRGHQNAVQVDTSNLYAKYARLEGRLLRIERRLDIVDDPVL